MKPTCRTLIVETHPVFAALAQRMLQGQNMVDAESMVVRDLDSAIAAMASGYFDMILFDVKLEESDTQAFWTSIVAQAQNAAVVAVGGPDEFESMVKALEHGARECLFRNLVCTSVLGDYMTRCVRRGKARAAEPVGGNLFPDLDMAVADVDSAFHLKALAAGMS